MILIFFRNIAFFKCFAYQRFTIRNSTIARGEDRFLEFKGLLSEPISFVDKKFNFLTTL